MTLPSDIHGVVYIPLDNGEWRLRLVKELKAAGLQVQWRGCDQRHSKTQAKAQRSCYGFSRRSVEAFGAHTSRLKVRSARFGGWCGRTVFWRRMGVRVGDAESDDYDSAGRRYGAGV